MKTLDNEMIAKRYLAGENTYKLGRNLGVSYETIRTRLHEMGIPIRTSSVRRRIYQCNHGCFTEKTINSMYYAGLLMADGNIRKDGRMVQIEVEKSDSCLLEGLKRFSGYGGELKHRVKRQRSGHVSEMVALRITSPQMVKDLDLFGVVPCKSKNGKIPQWVTRHPLAEFFFRGIFDGDGCVGIRRGVCHKGKKFATFCGNISVVNSFRNWVEQRTGDRGGLFRRSNGLGVIHYSHGAVSRVGLCIYGNKTGMRLVRKSSIMCVV